MFKVLGGTSGVRFKDLWLYSRVSGRDCNDSDYDLIRLDNMAAIHLDIEANAGDIKDVIVENVTITAFTYGIKATSANDAKEISDIKIRGYRPSRNFRQLYVDASKAYDWDVQNLNISGMLHEQGGVRIVRSGRPSGYSGLNGGIKFLQLNCNAIRSLGASFCVQVAKHGGLYFKQLHYEGVRRR
jgi:hypothetical protein